ncbi:hypothetical protein EZS27_002094 [termite gut metagenome]|uniref:Uncharacterized protein n=1 Tax=termite gut metagenome TaxID=433724 RepID=A0A5J4SWW1_9ZZZZ
MNEEERKIDNPEFDYAALSDDEAEFGRANTVKEKGFYILPSELFSTIRKVVKNDANLNETLAKVFNHIKNSAKGAGNEDDLKGLFDDSGCKLQQIGRYRYQT